MIELQCKNKGFLSRVKADLARRKPRYPLWRWRIEALSNGTRLDVIEVNKTAEPQTKAIDYFIKPPPGTNERRQASVAARTKKAANAQAERLRIARGIGTLFDSDNY